MEGYCTPDCGQGYYADQKTRTCHGNNALHVEIDAAGASVIRSIDKTEDGNILLNTTKAGILFLYANEAQRAA